MAVFNGTEITLSQSAEHDNIKIMYVDNISTLQPMAINKSIDTLGW